jgi:hypothetical protein
MSKTTRPKITRIVIDRVILGNQPAWVWKLYDRALKNRYESSSAELDDAFTQAREGVRQIETGVIVI